jgi:hypothetical protein
MNTHLMGAGDSGAKARREARQQAVRLAAAIQRDNEREEAGMHADDRATCYMHRCWASDCEDLH